MILSRYAQALERLPRWVGKPLGLCEKCFAGQAALWAFVFWNNHLSEIWAEGLQFIGWAIFCTFIINRVFSR